MTASNRGGPPCSKQWPRALATRDISGALNMVADMFALYMKTKNFHWRRGRTHDYHLLLDDQAGQIYATTDAIAERVRKLGGTTLRSIGHIARLQRVWTTMPVVTP
jgi:starvation-inducible DNA-binding protein